MIFSQGTHSKKRFTIDFRIRPETSAPGAEPLLPVGFGACYEVVSLGSVPKAHAFGFRMFSTRLKLKHVLDNQTQTFASISSNGSMSLFGSNLFVVGCAPAPKV